jgi:hypothetical protein
VSYPERLGEAFCHLLERYPTDRLPAAGGITATVVVTITLDHLLDQLGVATLDDRTRITAGQARRLACQAGIIPLVLGGDSVPLDAGRHQRLHNRYQRIALAHRDQGCTADGCDRPPARCEAHHDLPWSHGGPTDVAHGRLLCPHHHRRVHDPGYTTTRLPDGTLRFHRRT